MYAIRSTFHGWNFEYVGHDEIIETMLKIREEGENLRVYLRVPQYGDYCTVPRLMKGKLGVEETPATVLPIIVVAEFYEAAVRIAANTVAEALKKFEKVNKNRKVYNYFLQLFYAAYRGMREQQSLAAYKYESIWQALFKDESKRDDQWLSLARVMASTATFSQFTEATEIFWCKCDLISKFIWQRIRGKHDEKEFADEFSLENMKKTDRDSYFYKHLLYRGGVTLNLEVYHPSRLPKDEREKQIKVVNALSNWLDKCAEQVQNMKKSEMVAETLPDKLELPPFEWGTVDESDKMQVDSKNEAAKSESVDELLQKLSIKEEDDESETA